MEDLGKEEPEGSVKQYMGQEKYDSLPMNFNVFKHHLFSESFASGEEAQQLCIGCWSGYELPINKLKLSSI